MIKYQPKIGEKGILRKNDNKFGKKGSQHYSFWGGLYDTKEEAQSWIDKAIAEGGKFNVSTIDKLDINFTDDPRVAKKEGWKTFWVEVWEESKYARKYYAKDKESLESDEANDQISDDISDNKFEWCKGQEEWEITEDAFHDKASIECDIKEFMKGENK
jgi:hypothetical protein